MLICEKCGKRYPYGSNFCPHCGAPAPRMKTQIISVKVICPNCGQLNLPNSSYCIDCGNFLLRQEKIDSRTHRRFYRGLSLEDSLVNAVDFLLEHPKILLISVFFIILDTLLVNTLTNSYLAPSFMTMNNPILLEFIINNIISLIVDSLFISWLLASFKQVHTQEFPRSVNLLKSFGYGLRYLPQIIAAKILVTGIIILVVLSGVLGIRMTFNTILYFLSGPIFFIVMAVIIVFLSYTSQSVIIDERSAIDSLFLSCDFVQKHFWVTLGIVIIFSLMTLPFIFINLTLPNTTPPRLIQTISTLCFAWAYDYGS
ncbi:MAG: zinc ribbon domain-containing protein [Promethearchaeota archaeon]